MLTDMKRIYVNEGEYINEFFKYLQEEVRYKQGYFEVSHALLAYDLLYSRLDSNDSKAFQDKEKEIISSIVRILGILPQEQYISIFIRYSQSYF